MDSPWHAFVFSNYFLSYMLYLFLRLCKLGQEVSRTSALAGWLDVEQNELKLTDTMPTCLLEPGREAGTVAFSPHWLFQMASGSTRVLAKKAAIASHQRAVSTLTGA